MWYKNKAEIQDFILIKVNDNMWIWKNSLPYRWISPISTEVIGNPQRFLKLVGEHWIRYKMFLYSQRTSRKNQLLIIREKNHNFTLEKPRGIVF